VAVGAVFLAIAARLSFVPLSGTAAPYATFYLAIILTLTLAGRGPAIVAALLGGLAANYFFVAPRFSFEYSQPADLLWAFFYLLISATLIAAFEAQRRYRTRAEAALRDVQRGEEALLRDALLIDLSHDAIIRADAHRVITGWNAGAQEMYGWTSAEAVGNVTHQLLQTKASVATGEIDEVLARTGRWEGELVFTGRDGRRIVAESRQVLVQAGDDTPAMILEINRDITERTRAQDELAAAHRRTAAILESITDGFNAFDREWRYTYVNASGARLVGKTPEDLLGKNIWELWPHAAESPFGVTYRRAVAENVPLQVEAFYPEPLNRWFEVRCYPFPEGLTLFFNDTTERRNSEERLRQKQKLESIGLLAGGVAHDFNNVLTVIMGSASLGLSECPTCQHSKAILAASERAAYLTKQLLAYAGKGNIVPKLIDLTDLVSQSTELLRASVSRRVRLEFDLAKDLPCVEADPSQIDQILMNLVINAGEAISPRMDGVIRVATSHCQVTPEITKRHYLVSDSADGHCVCLEVRDNGSGMDEATVARIFDPFFSTKFLGRGLGLAAVHGIVRSNQGFIEVRSAPGAGTTFRVFLPASEKRPSAEPQPGASRVLPQASATILVVDDEEMVRKMAGTVLRQYGYKVLEAQHGMDALQVLAGASPPPSLALIDVVMPVMGGDELVPILAAQYPALKIVMSSGYPEEEAHKVFPSGMTATFLRKPYTGTALAEKIAEVLNR